MEQTYKDFIQNIIDTRGQWNILEGSYYESHHIIPVCMGGQPTNHNKKKKHENLIWLYPEEHFIAHKLLAEENLDNKAILLSWVLMSNRLNKDINANEYKILREAFIKSISHPFSEERKIKLRKPKSEEGRKNIVIASKERWLCNPVVSDETRKKCGDTTRGTHTYTNGIIEKRIKPGEPIPEGFYYGRKPYTFSDEAKNNLKLSGYNRRKKVIDLNTGTIYHDVEEAALKLGYTTTTIINRCNHTTKNSKLNIKYLEE